ncbi:MAG TPA: hypothetical protein VMP11_16810 [Verrucomicrobiae bacterium]|nr:hypothetical protein [Verrucomicrobiae bacterium]
MKVSVCLSLGKQVQRFNAQRLGDEEQLEIVNVDHLGFDAGHCHPAFIQAGALQFFCQPIL